MSDATNGDRNPNSTFQTCLWVFLLLLAYRLVRAFIFKRDLTNDDCEINRVALSLVRHMGFANPFKIPTGPTSHVAPIYPYILGGMYRLFGTGSTGEAVRQILACSATSLQFALLPALAIAAGIGTRVGVLAALIGGLSPLRNWIETKGTFETPYAALLLVALTLLTLHEWNREKPSIGRAWFYGVAWGLALLVAPQLLSILFGYLALGALRFYPDRFRSYLKFSLIYLIVAGFVLMPWTLRNYSVFHRLIFVRGSFGLEVNVANSDTAQPSIEQNLWTKGFQSTHPSSSRAAAQEVARVGESEFYREQLHTAERWISSHPRRFLQLTAERIRYFWLPPVEPYLKGTISTLVTWTLTLMGIAGLFMMRENHRRAAMAIGGIWLTYPLVYYLLQFDLRYRYPIEWTFVLSAAYCLTSLADYVMPWILRGQIMSNQYASFRYWGRGVEP